MFRKDTSHEQFCFVGGGIPEAGSAERVPARARLMNNRSDVIFYCPEGERSRAFALQNPPLYLKTLSVRRRTELEPVNVECIWIEIRDPTCNFLLCCTYRPPNSDKTFRREISLGPLIRDRIYPTKLLYSSRWFKRWPHTHPVNEILASQFLETNESHAKHDYTYWPYSRVNFWFWNFESGSKSIYIC